MNNIKIVWSWSSITGHKAFLTPYDEALSIMLSVRSWSKYYPNTELVTTKLGKYLLQDVLKLDFAKVVDNLPENDGSYPWNYSKFHAFKKQDRPFLHVDYDTYIFTPLPKQFLEGEVLLQSKEQPNDVYQRVYEWYETANIVHPEIFLHDKRKPKHRSGYCAGVIGFNNLGYLDIYNANTFDILENEENKGAFVEDYRYMILEQGVLDSMCAVLDIPITTLIGNYYEEKFKYVHAWANTKRDRRFGNKLIKRIYEIDSAYLQLANEYANEIEELQNEQ